MNLRCQNMYQSARESAGLTQESAAELLGISTKSIQCYEAEHTIPSVEMVKKMVLIYRAPWLGNYRCNRCPLGAHRSLPETQLNVQQLAVEYALAALQSEKISISSQTMLEIALDSKVTDGELEDFIAAMTILSSYSRLEEKARIVLATQI